MGRRGMLRRARGGAGCGIDWFLGRSSVRFVLLDANASQYAALRYHPFFYPFSLLSCLSFRSSTHTSHRASAYHPLPRYSSRHLSSLHTHLCVPLFSSLLDLPFVFTLAFVLPSTHRSRSFHVSDTWYLGVYIMSMYQHQHPILCIACRMLHHSLYRRPIRYRTSYSYPVMPL